MTIKLLILFLACCYVYNSMAQPEPCRAPVILQDAMQKAELQARQQQPLAVSRMIRVYFRVFRNDDGLNSGAALWQIESEFAQLQEDFAPNNICFANMGVEFINHSDLNTNINVDVASTYLALFGYAVPGAITIFYHANLTGAGGTAYNIPNTFFSIQRDNIGFARTISHEMGHCLGLLHTFEPAHGLEYINGTECTERGDRVCDTPADPWTFNGIFACFSNNGCQYTGNCTDPNGGTLYSPPYYNIMSYWGTVGCAVNHFTSGQYARANAYLAADAGLLGVQSPSSLVYGPATNSSGLLLRSAIFGVTTTGTVTLNNSVTASFQGQSVTLNPGFTAAPSSGSVLIRAAACNY